MRSLAALALVASVVIAGGTGAFPAGAATGPASCKLLKRAEITAALDQPAGPGTDELAPTVCQWNLAPTSERAAGTVNAFVERGSKARRDFATAAEFDAGDQEPVTGLGRKALYTPSTGTVWVLEDRSTLFYVQANVNLPDGTRIPGTRDALVQLATQAEARV